MDSIAYFLTDSQENLRTTLKTLRSNAVDIFSLDDIRINKDAFNYILSELEDTIKAQSRVGCLRPVDKLAACLRFFAEGNYQHGVGKDWHLNISQSTFSKILAEVLSAFEEVLCPKWINVKMDEQTKEDAKIYFYQKSSIPGVTMAIDGTHVKIFTPSKDRHLFYNRKGYHSLNVMLGCDHLNRIRSVNAAYPGSCHDSHVWKLSNIKQYFESQYHLGDNSRLLGDGGYPLEPWLLTPYRSAGVGSKESKYNVAHAKGRNIIERTIGILKNCFRCLINERGLHYCPEKAASIINVCCALHNIRIHFCRPYEHLDDVQEILETEEIVNNEDYETVSNEAILIRNNILNTF